MQNQVCLFCGYTVSLVYVHGHYQCPVCNTNALPCCDGDNCGTNILLKESTAISVLSAPDLLVAKTNHNPKQ